jgi:hypothetical protein
MPFLNRQSGLVVLLLVFSCTQSNGPVRGKGAITRASISHPAVGCWLIQADGYQGYAKLPVTIRLDSVGWSTPHGDTVFRGYLDSSSVGPGLGLAHWRPLQSNSVELAWGDGLAGVKATMTPSGDGFVGIPGDWTDMDPNPRGSGHIALVPTPCDTHVFSIWLWARQDSIARDILK